MIPDHLSIPIRCEHLSSENPQHPSIFFISILRLSGYSQLPATDTGRRQTSTVSGEPSRRSSLGPKFEPTNSRMRGELRIHSWGSSIPWLVPGHNGNRAVLGSQSQQGCSWTLSGHGLGWSSRRLTALSPCLLSESGGLARPSVLSDSQYSPNNFLFCTVKQRWFLPFILRILLGDKRLANRKICHVFRNFSITFASFT